MHICTCAYIYTYTPVSRETHSCPYTVQAQQIERYIIVTDSSVFVVS